ncbi:MAG: GAF domain-containing protein [Candidatus Zixiibacteriota bacterium]
MKTLEPKVKVPNLWKQIELAVQISKILRDNPKGRKSLMKALDLMAELIPFESATIYLFNEVKNELEEIATRGETVNVLDFLRFGPGTGLAGWAAGKKQPMFLPGREPGIDRVHEHHDSVLVLPLLVEDNLVGVMCFSNGTSQIFNINHNFFFELVSIQIAVSLERINYMKQLDQKNLRLEQTQTQLRETQSQLMALEKFMDVSDLVTSINHEVNDLLSAIVGNVRIIELESADLPEKISKNINAIVDGARQISLITHKLTGIESLVSKLYTGNNQKSSLNHYKFPGNE